MSGLTPAMGGTHQERVGELWIYQAAPDGVAGQIDAIAQPQLLEDVGAMALDGLLAEHQQRGNLLRGSDPRRSASSPLPRAASSDSRGSARPRWRRPGSP